MREAKRQLYPGCSKFSRFSSTSISGTVAGETIAKLIVNLSYLVLYFYIFLLYPILFIIFFFILMDVFNSTHICLYGMCKSFGPPKSTQPIITSGYEICPCLIKMIQDKPFSGEGNENPYLHLQEFEQTCACL